MEKRGGLIIYIIIYYDLGKSKDRQKHQRNRSLQQKSHHRLAHQTKIASRNEVSQEQLPTTTQTGRTQTKRQQFEQTHTQTHHVTTGINLVDSRKNLTPGKIKQSLTFHPAVSQETLAFVTQRQNLSPFYESV